MRPLHVLFAGAVALPVAVEAPRPEGHHATSVSVAAGGGTFALVTRGCEGRVLTADKYRLRDAGAAVVHQFPGPASVGVRAGVTEVADGALTNSYVNPHASLDWRLVGIGGGYIRSSDFLYTGGEVDFGAGPHFGSGHLRIGERDRVHLVLSVAEGVPIYSDGGLVEIGVGFKPHPRVRALATYSTFPYDGGGLGLHTSIETLPDLHLDLAGRLGGSSGVAENAVKVGITYRAVHGAER